MKDKTYNLLLWILGIILISCIFSLGFTIGLGKDNLKVTSELKFENSNCSNLSLLNTTICLERELKTFYKYNITNIGKDLSLEKLKDEGGVCKNFAEWYYNLIDDRFNKQTLIININKSDSHEVSIISNEEGYCILDQLQNQCWEFKDAK